MKKRSWWHIRNNNKTKHAALIVDEDSPLKSGKYSYMDITYMDITTHPAKHESYILLKKPINKKADKSYVRKYVGKQKKKIFSRWIMKYQISDEDMDIIEDYLKNKK